MSVTYDKQLETRLIDVSALDTLAMRLEKTVAESYQQTAKLTQLVDMASQITQLQTDLEKFPMYKSLADEVADLREKEASLSSDLAAFKVFLPDSELAVFGLRREQLANPQMATWFPAIRAWCGLVEWSKTGTCEAFLAEFKKFASALLTLRDDAMLDNIRSNIAEAISEVVARNLRADIQVNWNYVGESYDENLHFSRGGKGTTIKFVSGALVVINGKILDRAEVETE